MNLLGDAPSCSDVDPKQLKRDSRRAIQAILRRMNNKLRFETVEELLVVKENTALARKRSVIGFLSAGAATGAAWRFALGTRSALPAAATGALMGMTYGMFSVREKFFLDLLSLPDAVSPFAREARKIVASTMPESVILREVRARRRERFPSFEEVDVIWTEPPPFSAVRASEDPPDSSDGASSGSASPLSASARRGRQAAPRKQTEPADGKDDDLWIAPATNDSGGESNSLDGWEDAFGGEQGGEPKPMTWEEIRRRSGTA